MRSLFGGPVLVAHTLSRGAVTLFPHLPGRETGCRGEGRSRRSQGHTGGAGLLASAWAGAAPPVSRLVHKSGALGAIQRQT